MVEELTLLPAPSSDSVSGYTCVRFLLQCGDPATFFLFTRFISAPNAPLLEYINILYLTERGRKAQTKKNKLKQTLDLFLFIVRYICYFHPSPAHF